MVNKVEEEDVVVGEEVAEAVSLVMHRKRGRSRRDTGRKRTRAAEQTIIVGIKERERWQGEEEGLCPVDFHGHIRALSFHHPARLISLSAPTLATHEEGPVNDEVVLGSEVLFPPHSLRTISYAYNP